MRFSSQVGLCGAERLEQKTKTCFDLFLQKLNGGRRELVVEERVRRVIIGDLFCRCQFFHGEVRAGPLKREQATWENGFL